MEAKKILRGLAAGFAIATSTVVPVSAEQKPIKQATCDKEVTVNPVDVYLAQEWFAGRPIAGHAYIMAEAAAKCDITIDLLLVTAMFETGGGNGVGKNDGWFLRWRPESHEKEIRDVAELLAGKGTVPSYGGKTNIERLQIFNGGAVGIWNSNEYRKYAQVYLNQLQQRREQLTPFFQIQKISEETEEAEKEEEAEVTEVQDEVPTEEIVFISDELNPY